MGKKGAHELCLELEAHCASAVVCLHEGAPGLSSSAPSPATPLRLLFIHPHKVLHDCQEGWELGVRS